MTAVSRRGLGEELGEPLLGTALEERLVGTAVFIRHGIEFAGGDIDHLVVGPGGVTVIAATCRRGHGRALGGIPGIGRRREPAELRKLERQCMGVRLALLSARPELRMTDVCGVICLAAASARGPETLPAGFVVCGSAAVATLAARPGPLSAEEVAHLSQTLEAHLPRVRRAEVDMLLGQAVSPAPPRGPGSRHRRRRPRGPSLSGRVLAAGVALCGGLIIAAGSTQPRHVVGPGVPRLTYLRLARVRGRPAVSFRAAAGTVVQITLVRVGHRRSVRLLASGRRQDWRVPRSWGRLPRLSARACAVDGHAQCVPPTLTSRLPSTDVEQHDPAAPGHAAIKAAMRFAGRIGAGGRAPDPVTPRRR